MSTFDVLDEVRDVDIDRTAFHAGRLRTVETAFRLLHRHLRRQTDVYFLQASRGAVDRIKLWHLHPLYGCTFLRLEHLAQNLAPILSWFSGRRRGTVFHSCSLGGITGFFFSPEVR